MQKSSLGVVIMRSSKNPAAAQPGRGFYRACTAGLGYSVVGYNNRSPAAPGFASELGAISLIDIGQNSDSHRDTAKGGDDVGSNTHTNVFQDRHVPDFDVDAIVVKQGVGGRYTAGKDHCTG
jgi:hypothetical protein